MSTPIQPESLAKRLALALIAKHYAPRTREDGQIVLQRDAHACILLWGPDALERVPDLGAIGDADILILGGSPEIRKGLKKARPMMTQGRVYLFHVDDGGDVWQAEFGNPGQLGPLLRRRDDLPEVDPETFEAQAVEAHKRHRSAKAEVQRFQTRLEARTPVATYALAGVIAVLFWLESIWGGTDSIVTLVHMGALIREQAFAEPWRLLSCSLLHAGFMHVAFNTYVLIALGRSLEQILGHRRFLVLYVASALGGSLASTLLLGEGISVGASGAVWGLLAAEAVLGYRPAGLLPAAVLPKLKRAALINLGLNIANSLRPEVDWAAHLGGGLVGAALIVTGLLTVGLPQLADASADATDRAPAWLRPVAVALTALLVAGGVLGIAMGKPWRLVEPSSFAARTLGTTGLQVELPETLSEERSSQQEMFFTGVYGDLMEDAMVVEVWAVPLEPPLMADEFEPELESFRSDVALTVPDGSKEIREVEETSEGMTTQLLMTHELGNGLILETAAVLTPDFAGRVSYIVWPQLRRGTKTGVAERVMRSISRSADGPNGQQVTAQPS